MKDKWKTLLQAVIISVVVVGPYTFFVIYSLAGQTIPGRAGTGEKMIDFGSPLVSESLSGIVLLSIFYFCILTIILYFVIYMLKKQKNNKDKVK